MINQVSDFVWWDASCRDSTDWYVHAYDGNNWTLIIDHQPSREAAKEAAKEYFKAHDIRKHRMCGIPW